jgi:glycosyltransferase involved in cell wall biosynthesis
MRILFVADGRSPIALQWMEYFIKAGHEVHLASTFACEPNLKFASLRFVRVAFSEAAQNKSVRRSSLSTLLPTGLRTQLRNWFGPATLTRVAAQLRAIIEDIQPDLVHAMRIPYEGMLAAVADPQAPLLISDWGNDFTLHARSNPFMAAATRKAMRRADALHTDTRRDQRLAQEWGFAAGKLSIVLPGNGGVRMEIFKPAAKINRSPQVINPRGMRAYVSTDVFFKSIPIVLADLPDVHFICPDMENEAQAQRWVSKLNIMNAVTLMPKLTATELATAFQSAQVTVSPSTHDGTPNSLLEAMACGCFPVAGDLESIREWITPGKNGLLVDPYDPKALATAIIRALKDSNLRARAAEINADLVAQRADYAQCMPRAEKFYTQIVGK